MARVKPSPKRRRRNKAMPVLGAAGLSLALASGASAATSAPNANAVTQIATAGHEMTLREEEVADVSLATFYVFDNEAIGASRSRLKLAGMGGCGGCAGCGGVGWACAWTGSSSGSSAFGSDGDAAPVRPKYAPRRVSKKP
jgi:hypothetical protein